MSENREQYVRMYERFNMGHNWLHEWTSRQGARRRVKSLSITTSTSPTILLLVLLLGYGSQLSQGVSTPEPPTTIPSPATTPTPTTTTTTTPTPTMEMENENLCENGCDELCKDCDWDNTTMLCMCMTCFDNATLADDGNCTLTPERGACEPGGKHFKTCVAVPLCVGVVAIGVGIFLFFFFRYRREKTRQQSAGRKKSIIPHPHQIDQMIRADEDEENTPYPPTQSSNQTLPSSSSQGSLPPPLNRALPSTPHSQEPMSNSERPLPSPPSQSSVNSGIAMRANASTISFHRAGIETLLPPDEEGEGEDYYNAEAARLQSERGQQLELERTMPLPPVPQPPVSSNPRKVNHLRQQVSVDPEAASERFQEDYVNVNEAKKNKKPTKHVPLAPGMSPVVEHSFAKSPEPSAQNRPLPETPDSKAIKPPKLPRTTKPSLTTNVPPPSGEGHIAGKPYYVNAAGEKIHSYVNIDNQENVNFGFQH